MLLFSYPGIQLLWIVHGLVIFVQLTCCFCLKINVISLELLLLLRVGSNLVFCLFQSSYITLKFTLSWSECRSCLFSGCERFDTHGLSGRWVVSLPTEINYRLNNSVECSSIYTSIHLVLPVTQASGQTGFGPHFSELSSSGSGLITLLTLFNVKLMQLVSSFTH